MEPHWRESVLRQDAYFSKDFQEDLSYDVTSREDFYNEIYKRESNKAKAIIDKKSKLKSFFQDIIKSRETHSSYNKKLKDESLFQPSRSYWLNYEDYLTYCICPFIMQFETYTIVNYFTRRGTEFLCVTVFYLTKLFVNWIITYIVTALGAYHKKGLFCMRLMLPITKYFPYLMIIMFFWQISTKLTLFSELLLYVTLYILAVVYVIDLEFHGCDKVPALPPGIKCFDRHDDIVVNRTLCQNNPEEQFIFYCGSRQGYLLSEQVVLQYIHYEPKYAFMRNVGLLILLVTLMFLCKNMQNKMKFIRLTLYGRVAVYIGLIVVSKTLILNAMRKELWEAERLWQIFEYGSSLPETIFFSTVTTVRNLPTLLFVQWAATARTPGSVNPGRDSVVIIMLDVVISLLEVFVFLLVYSNARTATLLSRSVIVGLNGNRIPIVAILLLMESCSGNEDFLIIVVLTSFSLSHFNAIACEYDALKFNISLINRKTFINSGLLSLALLPALYAGVICCRNIMFGIEITIVDALGQAFTITSLLLFMIIFLIYSFERFQIDVEFMTGSAPGYIYKILIYIPLIYSISMIILSAVNDDVVNVDLDTFFLISLIISVSCIIAIIFTYSTQEEDFRSLLVPTFFYGPPNHELRKERKLFRGDRSPKELI